MDSKSFTYFSHFTMKDELVNLTPNQLDELRAFFVERYVDNMDTKDLVQYVMDDMMKYMESLPDNQVIDECVNYWDDHFENVVDEIKEYVDCEFKIPIEREIQQMNELRLPLIHLFNMKRVYGNYAPTKHTK